MSEYNLNNYHGVNISDDGEFSNLHDVIDELTEFLEQFDTHAMSDEALVLRGKAEAYLDVIDYLTRISPVRK